MERSYGTNFQDQLLQRITHRFGVTPVSEQLYGRNISAGRIATWSQQAGALPPDLHSFGYDAVNQLLSATVTNAGALVNSYAYAYDLAGNRLTERTGLLTNTATYNTLNQISTTTAATAGRTNEWDAADRLVAINAGGDRTEFTYDGFNRLASLRHLTNGIEAAYRRFVWSGNELCEERNAAGSVIKRFFAQGVKLETGPTQGSYFYTRDHLGSIRELLDTTGNVRARYAYDPWGRRTKLGGDVEADLGFAGMFWSPEVKLSLTRFRAYDPELGRWLSRDPLKRAEISEGPNLYAYVANNPINFIDPEGLCITTVDCTCLKYPAACAAAGIIAAKAGEYGQRVGSAVCALGGRVRAIAERVPDAIQQFREYVANPWSSDNIMRLGVDYVGPRSQKFWAEVYNLPPQLWIDVTMSFDEVALLLSQRLGISLPQARAFLSELTGFVP